MNDFSQKLINGIDKTTVDGFAEALLIAITNLKDKEGGILDVHIGTTFEEDVDFAMQIARMMLDAEKNNG